MLANCSQSLRCIFSPGKRRCAATSSATDSLPRSRSDRFAEGGRFSLKPCVFDYFTGTTSNFSRQKVVFLRQHSGGRLAANLLRGSCILREKAICPLYWRISGVFHKKSDPDFPPKILRSENASAEYFLQIPLVQGVLRGNKKSPVRGPAEGFSVDAEPMF